MDMFFLTLKQMLMMVSLMLVGYILRKKNIVPDNSGIILSKLETYIFVPALSLINQINNCTVETFVSNSGLMIYGIVLIVITIGVSTVVSRLFVRNANQSSEQLYQRNLYKYALTFSNYGFMGNFIILGIWGDMMFYKYSMFTFFVALACSSWGLYILIPKERKASILDNLKKGLLTPPIIALAIGMAIGLLNLKSYVPDFALNAVDSASKCMGPVAMVLAGMVIGGYDIKKMFSDAKVYAVTFLRLIVIPAIIVITLKLIGTSDEIAILALIAFGTPIGMNTIVYPAAYGGDTKTGASMTLVSHILSVITIPVMYYLLIVLL